MMEGYNKTFFCGRHFLRLENSKISIAADRKYKEMLILSRTLTTYDLNFASVDFAGGTRHQVRSCSTLPQALDNAVDSVKSALPKGKQSRIFGFHLIVTQQVIFKSYKKFT